MTKGILCKGLSKAYGGITVVRNINLNLRPGEIRAVVGENGAGKSTLMKMISGIITPTEGVIEIDGKPVRLNSPRDASDVGIAIVHQELQVVPALSIIDNIMLVRPPEIHAMRGSKAESSGIERLLARVGLACHPSTKAGSLSAAESQLLEVAKALALGASYIIFDEPTSALPAADVDNILELIESLKNDGLGILYISHHLSEVMRLADNITVLRDGNLVGDLKRSDTDTDHIIKLMVDRPVSLFANDLEPCSDEVIFEATELATANVRGLDFSLHRGEILGFSGLIGSGMHDAAMALAGEDRVVTGSLVLGGVGLNLRSPHEAARAGIALVPEERKAQAIVPDLSVHSNLHLGRNGLFGRFGILDLASMKARTSELVREFNIRLSNVRQSISTLSGGNQQKVVFARCVQGNPRVLIIAEPTRGVDIGAKDEIHRKIIDLAANGTAIIIVSSELEEVLALSHRVAVFTEKRMVGILLKSEATPENVMKLATPSGSKGALNAA